MSDEKMKPTIELDFGLSPPISIQEEMGIGSFVRVPEQGLILKIGRHRFGQGNGTIIVLEEMTTLLELYKLKDFYLLVIVANKLVYMPRKGIAKDMLEEPLRYWTKSHANCLMKSQTPMSYELCHGKQRTGQEPKEISLESYGAIDCMNLKISSIGCVFKESPPWRRSAYLMICLMARS